ncbi:MAG: tRNA uridine-5-carboxymethylaminomethyl(34) synthesis GTPase MnmE [Thermodesulfobacteriota bacterium]
MTKYLSTNTVAAISTPPGTGGIGIIRISGENAFNIGIKIFRKKNKENNFISLDKDKIKTRYLYYGFIFDPFSQEIFDEVLIVFMKAPYSYTAEDVVEIQAHSGRYNLKKILFLVNSMGADSAQPGEFTKRAFLNGRIGLTQAEAVMDLINSSSELAHKTAVNLSMGALGSEINSIIEELTQIESRIVAFVDFPDDADEDFDQSFFYEKLNILKTKTDELIENHNSGHQLREGFKIAIVGPPNAGKSSLLNRLLYKDRSIVTSQPGTTRDVIEESLNLNGFPLVVSDTAGIRNSEDEIEKIGISRSRQALASSDLVIFMVDGSDEDNKEALELYEEIKNLPYIFVVNKKDLISDVSRETFFSDLEPVYISALKSKGIDELKKRIYEYLESKNSDATSYIIPNQRQYELLKQISLKLKNLILQTEEVPEFELISYDIRDCIDLCCEITGNKVSPDILDKVFTDFCIGK